MRRIVASIVARLRAGRRATTVCRTVNADFGDTGPPECTENVVMKVFELSVQGHGEHYLIIPITSDLEIENRMPRTFH